MTPQRLLIPVLLIGAGVLAAVLVFYPRGGSSGMLSGYIEGEPLYPAAPVSGRIVDMAVKRGDVVKAGQKLFAVDPTQLAADRDEAMSQLVTNRALAVGAATGQRPQELAQIRADLSAQRAVLSEAEKNYNRTEPLYRAGAASKAQLDSVTSSRDRARASVAAGEERLKVAQLGQRSEQVTAARERVKQAQSNLTAIDARLAELSPTAPADGRIEDVFYQPGEWAPGNQAILSLIPDDRVRLRFFVGEGAISRYTPGAEISFACDGCKTGLKAKISYVSPRPEFTPPVIYAREARDRMVFLVEATPADPAGLNPGQPIDVTPLP